MVQQFLPVLYIRAAENSLVFLSDARVIEVKNEVYIKASQVVVCPGCSGKGHRQCPNCYGEGVAIV
jgi:hypothetical protein